MQESAFSIKTESFEGPLDLLLSLIEKRKLLVNEVSLSKITDDYIAHIENIPDYKMGERAEFIVVASTLLLIKSRSLLPTLTLSDEEESDIEDLENRLKIYQKIKDLSVNVKNSFGKQFLFNGGLDGKKMPVFSPHPKISLQNIRQSLMDVIINLPKKEVLQKATIRKVITIEEMIDKLTSRVQTAIKMSFREFSGGVPKTREEKVEVIVGFLALLELVKQGTVGVYQHGAFSDIEMETESVGLPKYS
jgi:segregation and condensation protein A